MGEEGTVASPATAMPPTYDEAKGLTDGDQGVKIAASETKIEMGKEKEKGKEEGFKGLSKEELMQYANDPFWVKLRWLLFILFWVIWVAMLGASVVIIVYAPKCPSPAPKQWWQKGPIYKASMAHFPDTQADGASDLKDVEQQLDYLVEAGVGSLYLTDIVNPGDLQGVRQEVGVMADLESLVVAVQERGLRLVIGFEPSSTSDQHYWWEEKQSDNAPFNAFYTEGTQLDLANTKVVDELVKALEFWLEKGVDGFVVQGKAAVPAAALARFREVLEAAEVESGVEKVMVVEEDWGVEQGEVSAVGAGHPVHLQLVGDLLQGGEHLTAADIEAKLDARLPEGCAEEEEEEEECTEPADLWPAFTFDTRAHGPAMVDALTMLKMLLPGTVVTAAGEEQGLKEPNFAAEAPEHLALYGLLTDKLRHQDAILLGKLTKADTFVEGAVFGLTRVKKGSPGYLLLINTGLEEVAVDVSERKSVPDSIRVLEKSAVMAVSPPTAEGEMEVKRFPSNEVPLTPGQAKIFNFVPKFD